MRHFLLALSFAGGWQGSPCLDRLRWPSTARGHLELSQSHAAAAPRRPRDQGILHRAEAAAYEKKRVDEANRDRRDGPPEVDVGRSYNELFYDRGTKLAPNRRTSLIVDPPNGRIPPMTPEAQARLKADQAYFAAHPADGPEDRPLPDRCSDVFAVRPAHDPWELQQQLSDRTNPRQPRDFGRDGQPGSRDCAGRPAPLPANMQEWQGEPRGHWEGDTLVVETSNFRFNERSRFGVQYDNGLTDQNLHITERFTRTGRMRSHIARPSAIPLCTRGRGLSRWSCSGRRVRCMSTRVMRATTDLAGVLKGARAQEKAAAPRDANPESGFRLPLPKREELDEQGKKFYDEIASQDGRNIAGLRGPMGIRLYSPKLGELQRELNQYLRFESGLSGPVRELAILVAARETDNQFEWAAHEPVARKEGLSNAAIDAVKNRKNTAGLADDQATIIELGREIFEHKEVSQETFTRAVNAFGKQGLVNVVSLMGSYASTAVLLKAFDMQLPPGVKPPLP